jgi:feruloyl esterase
VNGLIQPEIRFELNLPANWNRRFYMHGNGGFAGETPEFGPRPLYRANALKLGFATVQTNTGHDAVAEPLATFALSYQKRVDYAFRAVHLTAVEAKRIVAAYYARAASYSYWDGCSTASQGRSRQRFPISTHRRAPCQPVDTVTSLWNSHADRDADPGRQMKLVADAVAATPTARTADDDPRRCDWIRATWRSARVRTANPPDAGTSAAIRRSIWLQVTGRCISVRRSAPRRRAPVPSPVAPLKAAGTAG